MIAAIGITIFAERRNIQPPLLLAFVGLLASFIPRLERLELEPEIILALVLPPLLFSAAREFSLSSFARRLGSIFNLGVLLVAVTTAAVGGVAAAVVPGLGIGAALVLGAVVSPPDAVSAVAVGRALKLPYRVMTVLKGESLINDAAALTLFTFATASVAGTRLFTDSLLLFLGYSALGGVLVGIVIGGVVHRVRVRLTNPSLVTVLSVLVPFAAYVLAEEIGASGVLAVVAAGFSLGHNATETGYAARIQERQFWRTADALLEAFVFAYIGLQLRFVLEDADDKGHDIPGLLVASLAVLATVTVVRLGWVFASAALARWRMGRIRRRLDDPRPEVRKRLLRGRRDFDEAMEARVRAGLELATFSSRENLVIGWTGMRGVVTLAAAAGVPLLTAAGAPFPGRDAIQAIAFIVTIGTLLIQGLTLPWLIRRLGISDPREAAERARQEALAERLAQEAAIAAATAFRDRQTEPAPRRMAERMLDRLAATENAEATAADGDEQALLALAREIVAARRAAVVKARDDRQLDDEVMREVLERLDLEEALTAEWEPRQAAR